MEGASARHDEADDPEGQGLAFRGDTWDLDGLLIYAAVGVVVVAGRRLDANALLLGMTTVQAGEELVIRFVGEGIPQGVLVAELLRDVAGVCPGGLGGVGGTAAGVVGMMVMAVGGAPVVVVGGFRVVEQ